MSAPCQGQLLQEAPPTGFLPRDCPEQALTPETRFPSRHPLCPLWGLFSSGPHDTVLSCLLRTPLGSLSVLLVGSPFPCPMNVGVPGNPFHSLLFFSLYSQSVECESIHSYGFSYHSGPAAPAQTHLSSSLLGISTRHPPEPPPPLLDVSQMSSTIQVRWARLHSSFPLLILIHSVTRIPWILPPTMLDPGPGHHHLLPESLQTAASLLSPVHPLHHGWNELPTPWSCLCQNVSPTSHLRGDQQLFEGGGHA